MPGHLVVDVLESHWSVDIKAKAIRVSLPDGHKGPTRHFAGLSAHRGIRDQEKQTVETKINMIRLVCLHSDTSAHSLHSWELRLFDVCTKPNLFLVL